jgi:hypothetical protein
VSGLCSAMRTEPHKAHCCYHSGDGDGESLPDVCVARCRAVQRAWQFVRASVGTELTLPSLAAIRQTGGAQLAEVAEVAEGQIARPTRLWVKSPLRRSG